MKLRIRDIRKKRGLTITQLADRIGKTSGYISMIERGAHDKRPSTDLLEEIAAALDVPASALLQDQRPIPVAGRVGAGAHVDLVDAFAKGEGLYFVACPDDLPAREIVAVEVDGDSMSPLIESGDVLLFTRHFFGVSPDAIGRVAICETLEGRALVKHIRPGRDRGTFDLYSINSASNAPEYGVRLKWAAPYRRHLRGADIERV